MEKINQFSMKRFILIMNRYVTFNLKSWLIALGALMGIIIIVGLLNVYQSGGINILEPISVVGTVLVMISGFILTSMTYSELHTPAKSQFFLTLPATTSEKLFAHWLVTSVVYILLANLLVSLAVLIYTSVSMLLWNSNFVFFNPFTIGNLELMGIYVIVHSIFFLGAIHFRKNNFMKTILSVFVIATIINIVVVSVSYLFVGTTNFEMSGEGSNPELIHFIENTLPMVGKIFLYGLLAPFCLLVSFYKLKEREV
ncbi:MAG: hypothetical protein ACOC4J_03850 [Bacteroidota bacterium]